MALHLSVRLGFRHYHQALASLLRAAAVAAVPPPGLDLLEILRLQSWESRQWSDQGCISRARMCYSSLAPQEYAARNYANDVYEYNNVLRRLNNAKRTNVLRDVYEDMLLDGVKPLPDTFSALLLGCLKGSRLQDAFFFFEEIKTLGLTPNTMDFNCLIATCGRCRNHERALQLCEEMELYGIFADLRTYTTLLSACGAAGRPQEAAAVVRRMTAEGLTLNKYCYSALITAQKNQEQKDKKIIFEKIFDILRQSRDWSTQDIYKPRQGFETLDEIDEVLYNLPTIEFKQPRGSSFDRRLTVYHSALSASAVFGNEEALKIILGMLKEDGLRPDAFCMAQIITCHLTRGEVAIALRAFNGYLNSGWAPALDLFLVFIREAMQGYSSERMDAAKKVLQELAARKLFLSPRVGGELLELASNEPSGDFSTANLIFDIMHRSQIVPTLKSLLAYSKGLRGRKIPEDDPRLAIVSGMLKNYQGSLDSSRRQRISGQGNYQGRAITSGL